MVAARDPAVAGSFYPADSEELAASVRGHLSTARAASAWVGPRPKALIVPHAGYRYSGPVAGSAYAALEAQAEEIHRVVLLGPSHRFPFRGLAVPTTEAFETPLGAVPVDRAALDQIAGLPQVLQLDQAHALEHSLEVQLPFLQELLGVFSLVPIAVGDASAETVAEVLEILWGGAETLVLVSSDLSHYHDYETARRLDRATSEAIEKLEPEALNFESACGRVPVAGLLLVARRRGLSVRTLDLRSSGDTAGPRDRVVGYGAYAVG